MIDNVENPVQADQQIQQEAERKTARKTAQEMTADFELKKPDADWAKQVVEDFYETYTPVDANGNRKAPPKSTDIFTLSDAQQKAKSVTEVVQQLIVDLKKPVLQRRIVIKSESGKVVDKFVEQIELHKVDDKVAPYVYSFIDKGLKGQLSTPDELVSFLESIRYLAQVDLRMFQKMGAAIQVNIEELGWTKDKWTDEQKDVVKAFIEEEQKQRSKGNTGGNSGRKKNPYQEKAEIDGRFRALLDRLNGKVRQISISAAERQQLEQEYRTKYKEGLAKGVISEKEFNDKLEEAVNRAESIQQEKIRTSFSLISDADNATLRTLGFDHSFKSIKELLVSGVLSNTEYQVLYEGLDQLHEFYNENDQIVEEMVRYRETATEDQVREMARGELARSGIKMGGNGNDNSRFELYFRLGRADLFKKYVEQQYMENKKYDPQTGALVSGQIRWNKLNSDIRDIFSDILGFVDTRPNDFWDQVFNPLLEGNIYKMLLQDLSRLSVDLKKDPMFEQMMVNIATIDHLPNDRQSFSEPQESFTYPAEKKQTLGAAMGVLQQEMQRAQKVAEYLHNVDVISELGLGFEQLKNYAARFASADADWIFMNVNSVNKAYMLYMNNLRIALRKNNNVVDAFFGLKTDAMQGLDKIQYNTFLQLKAMASDPNDPELDRKLKRAVRMASGLSRGFTGEYWGLIQSAHMPNDFGSTSSRPMEQMASQLNLDILLERFVLPNYMPQMRYAYALRIPPLGGGHFASPWSADGTLDHTRVYKIKKMIDDAEAHGRTDEMVHFDETFVTLADYLWTRGIDLKDRGGWRLKDKNKYILYKKEKIEIGKDAVGNPIYEEGERYDFERTMLFQREMGTDIVRQFIDELIKQSEEAKVSYLDFDQAGRDALIDVMSRMHSVEELAHKNKIDFDHSRHYTSKQFKELVWSLKKQLKGGHGHPKFEDELKMKLYEEWVFDPIIERNPTEFLGLENMRYTPWQEKLASTQLMERMQTYFKTHHEGKFDPGYIKDHIYPQYIYALGAVEKYLWLDRKKQAKVDYILSEADIRDEKVQAVLSNYYIEMMRYLSVIDKNGEIVGKNRETEEEFKRHFMEFFQDVRQVLGSTSKMRKGAGHGQDDHGHGSQHVIPGEVVRYERTIKKTEKKGKKEQIDQYGNKKMVDKEDIVDRGNVSGDRRWDEKGREIKQETLSQRYAKLLWQGYTDLRYYMGADMDMSYMYWQSGGDRPHARMFNEVNSLASKMNPALIKILNEAMPKLVNSRHLTLHSFEEAVTKDIVPEMKAIHEAISDQAKPQADGYILQFLALTSNIIGEDTKYRVHYIGAIREMYDKHILGNQASLIQEALPDLIKRPTTAASPDELHEYGKIVCDALKIPFQKANPKDYEPYKLLGFIPWGNVPIPGKEHEYHFEQFEEAALLEGKVKLFGIPTVNVKWLERYTPLIVLGTILAILALAKAASDKDKKGGGGH